MKKEIKKFIEECYKTIVVNDIALEGDYLYLKCEVYRKGTPEKVAKNIFSTFGDIRVVHFIGDEVEQFFTRETLSWLGYAI